MTTEQMHRHPSSLSEGVIATAIVVAVIGGLFAAEGLLGYFYNYSMFLEGWDHILEISGGIMAIAAGALVSAYVYLRR